MPKQDPKWKVPVRFKWPRHLVKLLGKIPDHEVARRAGVGLHAVADERRRRGLPSAFPKRPPIEWTDQMISLLGTAIDREVAAELGISASSVSYQRKLLKIPVYCKQSPRRSEFWTPQRDALLATASDSEMGATDRPRTYKQPSWR